MRIGIAKKIKKIKRKMTKLRAIQLKRQLFPIKQTKYMII